MNSRYSSFSGKTAPRRKRTGKSYRAEIVDLADHTAGLPPSLRYRAIRLVRGVVAMLARVLGPRNG